MKETNKVNKAYATLTKDIDIERSDAKDSDKAAEVSETKAEEMGQRLVVTVCG